MCECGGERLCNWGFRVGGGVLLDGGEFKESVWSGINPCFIIVDTSLSLEVAILSLNLGLFSSPCGFSRENDSKKGGIMFAGKDRGRKERKESPTKKASWWGFGFVGLIEEFNNGNPCLLFTGD